MLKVVIYTISHLLANISAVAAGAVQLSLLLKNCDDMTEARSVKNVDVLM